MMYSNNISSEHVTYTNTHNNGTFIKKSSAAISLVAHRNESGAGFAAVFTPSPVFPVSPPDTAGSLVLGIRYVLARDVGLMDGGVGRLRGL
jgi:hypothetical protein